MSCLTKPPQTETELLERANAIAGMKLAELATQYALPVPDNLKKTKGWVGELLEIALGATASTLPEPDFQQIGVELKTIPVKANGLPKESTYVCTAPLINLTGLSWSNSTVKKKLQRVLWLPIQSEPSIELKNRRIGQAIIWSPSREQESVLKQDWLEIIELIALGKIDTISTSIGKYLQLRPKAANAKSLSVTVDETGNKTQTLPRGFYLRASFTEQVLHSHYHAG